MALRSLFLSLLALSVVTVAGCPSRVPDPVDDDDDSAVVNPGGDADGDGYCSDPEECDNEELEPGDCDDNDPTSYPGADEVCDAADNDCDGNVDENFDADQDGYYTQDESDCIGTYELGQLDCNDFIALINPGADEACDGADTNCDGIVDNPNLLDADNDGFRWCDAPADCDDTDNDVFPGAQEQCDGEDTNCDGVIDNGTTAEFLDADGDTFTPCSDDCDDADINAFPGNPERCDDVDNDCDGDVDEEEDLDQDGDGAFGPYPLCADAFGADNIDCDDQNATVFPGNAEICDNLDNNCSGTVDENLDFDGDGYLDCTGDCDSLDGNVYPGAVEACNGVDDDCNGIVDDGFDGDGDGQSACAGDCDDAEATVYAGAPELCDGIDNDCDGVQGPNESDIDGDSYSECDGDCDETDVSVFPGATETCNGVDDDCDGTVPGDELDADLDGYVTCTPPGCSIALVSDDSDSAYWSGFTALDPLGLDYDVYTDAEVAGTLSDLSNIDSQVIIWSTGYREITTAEFQELMAWLGNGNGLVVTGEGVLYDGEALGDDDDSAVGDDDDSAVGDDDDSAVGDDDDSAAPPAPFTVDASMMAQLVGSLTTGLGPETNSCVVSNANNPVSSGPWGSWSTAYTFTASSSVHDNATVNQGLGAVRVASVGSRSKIIWRPVTGGGRVAYWNGNDMLGDWSSADQAAMLRNIVTYMNNGCGGALSGGDCDDTNPTLNPNGNCP